MKLFLKTLCALALILGLVGCAPGYREVLRETFNTPVPKPVSYNPLIYRVVDEEAGVVCWVMQAAGGNYGGIACLPLSQTRLDGE